MLCSIAIRRRGYQELNAAAPLINAQPCLYFSSEDDKWRSKKLIKPIVSMALDNYQEVKVTSCPEVIRSKTSGLQPKEPPKILGHKKETRPKRKRLLHCDKLSRDKFFLLLLLFLTSIPPTSAKSERPYSMVDEDDTRLGDDRPKMFVDYVRGPLRGRLG